MAITDELREWARNNTVQDKVLTTYPVQHPVHGTVESLLRIADRIDAEHERQLEVLYRDMSDAEYVELPKDADGVPIHLGDEVYQVEGGWVYTIESITLRPDNTTVTFSCKHGFGCDSSNNVRHYHAPTVEDTLHELIGKALMLSEIDGENELVTEYAKRLRLADNGEER